MSNELSLENKEQQSNMMQVNESRAVAEVQAAFVIAKRFPRDQETAYQRIIKSCQRSSLAEQALYAYPRGGQTVTGPSIRLAEALAQNWGNIDCGVREISQENGVSVAESFAIDLETNMRVVKVFHVEHVRSTKKGKYKLTDPRDIYELVANQGARRLRACILAIIPGDIVESAVDTCKNTIESSKDPIEKQVDALIKAFSVFGVTAEDIEKLLDHKLEIINSDEIVTLRGIYKSMKDGVADKNQFFNRDAQEQGTAKDKFLENLNKDKPVEQMDW